MISTNVERSLFESILWATTDDNGRPLDAVYAFSDVDPAAVCKLSAEFYQWRDKADSVMIGHGFGDISLEDLLGANRVEHCYVLTRDGHGVGMTDRWLFDTAEWRCCRDLERLAERQGEICAYVGDDNRIHI